ncbi:MAG: LysR family transcriptional regulator [Pseudomonadota bacterium]
MTPRLNYHHLRYFREVASTGHLGQAAARLNVSQSSLSVQIKTLEESLGFQLFDRVSRKLVLTEAGRITLDYADQIFRAGDELLATLQHSNATAPPLRVGALSTLSRNFQLQFLRPILQSGSHRFWLKSGNTDTLLADLEALELDVVLTTQVPAEGRAGIAAARIAAQPIGVHGQPGRLRHQSLAQLLAREPLILPTDPVIRSGFQNLCARLDLSPLIVAHVDDMAMVRLLAREGIGLAIAPAVVLADELATGRLATAPFALDLAEPFFALTIRRRFPHPALAGLLGQGPHRSEP